MVSRSRNGLGALALAASLTTGVAGAASAAQAGGEPCPVTQAKLVSALKAAVAKVTEGDDAEMWAVVVDRGGTVCRVAFSGPDVTSQFLVSRQVAAAKAFTTNGLSLDGKPLASGALYGGVQPGASLFGLAEGNPLDAAAAYAGRFDRFGTANDPMLGHRVGGTITFGGGVPLFRGGSKAVGGLGLSGDTACADDTIARETRKGLGLVPSADDRLSFGPGKNQHPTCG